MQEGSREIIRVQAKERALSRLPPKATAKERKAPKLPREASHLDIHTPGTVTVTLVGLWQRRPESSRTQRRTWMEDGTARRKRAT